MASRGADEIASFLLRYFQQNHEEEKRHLIAYLYSCGGQNKNSMIVSLWLYLILIGRFDHIEHKFLLPGHTYLPVDSDFGVNEKKKKTTQHVYTSSDWCILVAGSRRKNLLLWWKWHVKTSSTSQSLKSAFSIKSHSIKAKSPSKR